MARPSLTPSHGRGLGEYARLICTLVLDSFRVVDRSGPTRLGTAEKTTFTVLR